MILKKKKKLPKIDIKEIPFGKICSLLIANVSSFIYRKNKLKRENDKNKRKNTKQQNNVKRKRE